jgi:two-component system, chemotaxis family, sensor histidine kinase and response regulator PixL
MINPDLRDSAYQFFIEEAAELLQIIETGLLTLKDEISPNKIHEIMRAAHSIKGGAASVELDAIRIISHRLEDFFRAFYSEEVILDAPLERLLLQGFDCLKNPLLEQINNGYFNTELALETAEPIFQQLQDILGQALESTAAYVPSSEDLGIDITASIFEVDVAVELERLQILINTESGNLATELVSIVEMFNSFAEMLEIKALTELNFLITDLINCYPERVKEIAKLALVNWHNLRDAILASQEILPPSPELLAFNPQKANEALDADFLEQAYQFFLEEAQELLPVIERGIISLTSDYTANKIHDIMRAAHSIKGGAASVGLETIRFIAHNLENYFKALAHPTIEITGELVNDLLDSFNYLKTSLETIINQRQLDEGSILANAQFIFDRIEKYLGAALEQSSDYLPSSEELGIDITASIFEIDVAENLDNLETAIKNNSEIKEYLATILDIFEGFAQMLNLEGFGEIGVTVRKALEYHPEQLGEIAEIALKDWQKAREQVLSGDRTLLNTVSAELSLLAFPAPQSENIIPTDFSTPALEDIFGEETPTIIPITPSLEDIFGLELIISDTEPIPQLEQLFSSPIVEDQPTENELSIPPLEDIFSPLPEASFPRENDVSIPPLEEVFSPHSLEDIFGSSSNLSENVPDTSLEAIFGAVEPQSNTIGIETTLAEINQNFDSLPAAESLPQNPISIKKNTVSSKSTNGKTVAANSTAAPASLSVRVDFNRLERMNNLVGELSINRNSLSLQNEQLQSSVKELLNRFQRFEKMTDGLREFADRMLVTEGIPKGNAATAKESVNLNQESETDIRWDTLEMDRYGQMYSQLQGMLEEMLQLGESVDDIVLFARGSNQTLETQRQMLTNLRDELMWARMLPLGEVLNRFPRILRDLSNSYHKSVRLKLSGTGVLVDKVALEKLYDPLLHLLRNAFDHGIELPQMRQEIGKPEEGQIEIRAYHQGNQTIIEVKDDGRGLNFDKIREKAHKNGLMTAEQLSILSKERLADLIFEPGFSTAEQVSELSGRGVGLDVVRSQLRALKGTVSVTSHPQSGTIFTLRLPLTLTIAKLLVCTLNADADLSHNQAVALPSDAIEEIIIPQQEQIKTSGQQRFLSFAGQIIPIYSLGSLLNYRCPMTETFSSKALASAVPSPADWNLPLLLLRRGQQLVALEVERLVTEQELVIKPFGNAIAAPSYSYGCTILGDGTLIPVINGAILLEEYENGNSGNLIHEQGELDQAEITTTIASTTPTILIVDDSAALRRTLALTLQKSGYRVLQARDGREALEQLQQNKGIQLVICDVEMPNMNGFEFLGQRRKYSDFMAIPVAMLTSRGSDKHRQLASHLGANAYFTKPYIEQQFLTAIRDLVAQKIPALSVN